VIPAGLVPAAEKYARALEALATFGERGPAAEVANAEADVRFAAHALADAVLEHMETAPPGALTPAQEAMVLAAWRIYRHDEILVERGTLTGPAVAYLAGRRDVRRRLVQLGLGDVHGYLTPEGVRTGAALADGRGIRPPSWNAQTGRVDL
jgi:hypothetical protein